MAQWIIDRVPEDEAATLIRNFAQGKPSDGEQYIKRMDFGNSPLLTPENLSFCHSVYATTITDSVLK